jgi:hypothetical protein
MTPAQTIGGAAKSLEDKAMSVPYIGDGIVGARKRGPESLNRVVADMALEPLGQKIPKNVETGRDSVGYVRNALSDAYEELIPKLSLRTDDGFLDALKGIKDSHDLPPGGELQKQLDRILEDKVFSRLTHNATTGARTPDVDGKTFKNVESYLSQKAKAFNGSPDPNQREVGEVLTQTLAALRQQLIKSNPDNAARLTAINQGYATYALIRKAASAPGAEGGVYSPNQLSSAVRAADGSVGRGAYARGDARLQKLAEAAQIVLPSKYPDSGTAGRLMQAGAVGGIVAGGLATAIPAALAYGASRAAYSEPGQRLAKSLIMGGNTRQAAGKKIQALSPYLAAALSQNVLRPGE